jgi:hypothetical protein
MWRLAVEAVATSKSTDVSACTSATQLPAKHTQLMSPQHCYDVLQKSIFHKVRDQQLLLTKVFAVDGDITQPGLGLAPRTAQLLQQELHIILHCAADIRLEVSWHPDRAAAHLSKRSTPAAVTPCRSAATSSCVANTCGMNISNKPSPASAQCV